MGGVISLSLALGSCEDVSTVRDVTDESAASPHITKDYLSEISSLCDDHKGGIIYLQGQGLLCLEGSIDQTMVEDLRRLPDDINVEFARIESGGGQLTAAIDIAEWIENKSADVIVEGICASSCAQFIFLGGQKKYLLDGAFLGFHGGPIPDASIDAMDYSDDIKASLKAEQRRFVDFYARHGVSLDMVTKPPEDIQKRLDAGEVVFWAWPVEALSSFGVDNIIDYRPD